MKIQQLDHNRILISLCDEDMELFCLDFDALSLSDEHSGSILRDILSQAAAATNTDLSNKHVLIEAIKHDKGCLLLLTLTVKKHRRIYRVKQSTDVLTFVLKDAERLLGCIQALLPLSSRITSSSVYLSDDHYYLTVYSQGAVKSCFTNTAMEYSTRRIEGNVIVSYLMEHGRTLSSDHALQEIGCSLNSSYTLPQ